MQRRTRSAWRSLTQFTRYFKKIANRRNDSEEREGHASPDSQARIQNPEHETQPLQAIDDVDDNDGDESREHDFRASQAIDEEEYPFQYLPTSTYVGDVDIHPGGDVIFILQHRDTEIRLRVLSTIITLASAVFKKMLEPTFREGRTLQANGEVEIALPDDDAMALKAMLYAMHLQHPQHAIPVRPSTIVNIGMLCDKYDCLESIYPSVRLWLGNFAKYSGLRDSRKTLRGADLKKALSGAMDALVAAVILNDFKMIDQFGRMVLGNAEHEIICPPRHISLFPMHGIDIFARLEDRRRLIRSRLHASIDRQIELYSDKCNNSWQPCDPFAAMLGVFIGSLRCQGLWPASRSANLSFLDFVRKLCDFYPRAPHCAHVETVDDSQCRSFADWNDACVDIRNAGMSARSDLEALHYSRDSDGLGSWVGAKKPHRRR